MKDYPLTAEMIEAGVPPIPRELFKWGMESLTGRPRHRNEKLIYIHLLPASEATVTRYGIKFRGQLYTCDKAEEEGWRFKARNKGHWRIAINHDPRIPGIIYLRASDNSSSIPCRLIHPDESLADKYDLAEIEEYLDHKTADDQRGDELNIETRTDMEISVEGEVRSATQITAEARAGTPGTSKASRLRGANERMKAEAEVMDAEYRREILESHGLVNTDDSQPANASAEDGSGEEYVPRPRFTIVPTY